MSVGSLLSAYVNYAIKNKAQDYCRSVTMNCVLTQFNLKLKVPPILKRIEIKGATHPKKK